MPTLMPRRADHAPLGGLMRRLVAPIGTALLTATLLLGTATVPARADGGAGGRDPGTGCVTVIDPPPTTSFGAFGISDGPGGVWFSHGTTVDRVVGQHIVQYPVPDTATARIGTLAGRPGARSGSPTKATTGSEQSTSGAS